jgi:hypothetical protein
VRRSCGLVAVTLLVVTLVGVQRVAAAPPAPSLVSPAAGASVVVPLTISWTGVTDPSGIVGYNWFVSPSSTFSTVIQLGSTNGATQATISGLANGTYFWRVDAVSGAFQTGAFSATRSFTVTGAGAGTPATPTLLPLTSYSTFHPREFFPVNWTAVPGAATYVLEAATDPNFPILTKIKFDNIPGTTGGFDIDDSLQGNFVARVFAVSASGIASQPSNLISFSVKFNNPIGPAPVLASPATGATVSLPVSLSWANVPYPQDLGYELQISKTLSFSSIEYDAQVTDPTRQVLSLTSGTKFWRVRSLQGDASPTTAALTAFSAVRSFTVPNTPPTPVSINFAFNPIGSGESTGVDLQLNAPAPAAGATIHLTSSNPGAFPVPATVAVAPNSASTGFDLHQLGLSAGQVTTPTAVTVTATLNGGSVSATETVLPPTPLSLTSGHLTGGAPTGTILILKGQAPPGGAAVSFTSSSPAMQPPATAIVPAGSESTTVPIPTSAVTTTTVVTITATYLGQSISTQFTLNPQLPPTSLLLSKTQVVNAEGATGIVTIASPAGVDGVAVFLTSSNPAVASVPQYASVAFTGTQTGFNITTTAVSVPTNVTISATGAGVTQSQTLTVVPTAPPPSAALTTYTVSPTSVVGGNPSTGKITLDRPAPAGGLVVHLTTLLPLSASPPASVTVPAGATSTTFTITTFPSDTTTVQLTASIDQVSNFVFAALSVNPPPTNPPPGTLPAPGLVAPSDGSKTKAGATVTFDWSDVTGAAGYTIQIDDENSFAAPQVVTQNTTASQFATNTLPTRRVWWRVRAVDSAGNPGAWSSSRRLN